MLLWVVRMLSIFSYLYSRLNRGQLFCGISFVSLLIIFLFLFGEVEAYSESANRNPFRIISQNKDFEYYKKKPYLVRAQNIVSTALGLPFSSNCRIYLNDNYKEKIKVLKGQRGGLEIYLNSSYSFMTKNRAVSCTILNAFVLSTLNLSYSKENIKKIIWFVGALNRRLNKQAFPTIYPRSGSFPGIHALLVNDYKLQPNIIMNNTVSPDNGVVYQINSEADEILLDSILSIKNGRKIVVDYLKNICRGNNKNTMDVFYSVLSENLQLSKKESKIFFIKHLNDIAFRSSVNILMPVSVKYAANVFQSACIVSYIPKNNPETIKICSLEDLPIVWDSIETSDKFIRKLERQFVRFKSFFPFFLRKPIIGIIKSLRALRERKDAEHFKEKILLYKKEFQEGVDKELELRRFLRDREIKHVRIPARYDFYFQVIDADDKNLNEFWPELNNYLANEFKFGN